MATKYGNKKPASWVMEQWLLMKKIEALESATLQMFTSKTALLERQVRATNLDMKGARAPNGVIHEKRWLRSRFAGSVSDVRVKSLMNKGVFVQVVILEEQSRRSLSDRNPYRSGAGVGSSR